ncbi:haloacid dehalogenase [Natrialba chahannaoensis JCM 10990]|uniref:Haloacid dehalogenase n=1 Tax=Natrialba chahannaoensis JCM 10990 TaxID=1227492 RepID=M0A7B0_9EURY|nr:HAD hydrolase-like protein [Natrialba chahannaoensis]ELY93223.1 haloacid dehalogenase [Natrialba chahannaoensis JCM 10990]
MTIPILFDMDGIILEGPRTEPQVYADAADAALSDFGVSPTPEQRRDLRRHGTDAVERRCAELEIDPDSFWKRKERYASEGTHERLRTGQRGRYDDTDVLADLAERTTIGLVTNNRHQTAEFVADYYDFAFDVVRGRDPTFAGYHRRKPDPYYIEDALASLELDSGDTNNGRRGLYVGDFEKDVTAGTAADLDTVFVRRDHNRGLERPADATYELESLSELPDILEELAAAD